MALCRPLTFFYINLGKEYLYRSCFLNRNCKDETGFGPNLRKGTLKSVVYKDDCGLSTLWQQSCSLTQVHTGQSALIFNDLPSIQSLPFRFDADLSLHWRLSARFPIIFGSVNYYLNIIQWACDLTIEVNIKSAPGISDTGELRAVAERWEGQAEGQVKRHSTAEPKDKTWH